MDKRAEGAAEEAIRAIGRGDADAARTAVAQAYDQDHGVGPLADAVYLACAQLDEEGRVSTATWNTLADAVGSGHLLGVVEASRIA